MSRKLSSGLACAALLLSNLACAFITGSGFQSGPAPTIVSVATQVVTIEPTATEDTAATAQAVEEQEAARAAAAEKTKQAGEAIAGTATAESQVTAQASGITKLVQQLSDKGDLKNTAGKFYRLDDFTKNTAMLGYYEWWSIDYQPTDFVLRAHVAWESASRTADWYASGCGFVFHANDVDNNYFIYLALDNNVYFKAYVDGKLRELGREYAGSLDRVKGEADVALLVEGSKVIYYVNDEKIIERNNDALTYGNLGYTVISGTNKDYGTRCTWTDIELWDMSKGE